MSEVTFAKAFLATLDKKPIKLAADHVSDPRKYPNQSPYILPKLPHPFPRKQLRSSGQPAKQQTITATLKPMRSGETVTISDLTLDSSIHDLKSQYAQKTSQLQEKIKLLLNKKPAADLKTLKDLGVDGDVEFSVMLMGSGTTPAQSPAAKETADPVPEAAPSPDKMEVDSEAPELGNEKAQAEAEETPATAAPGAGGPSGPGALNTMEFWTDLQDFLTQRLRDKGESERLVEMFKHAWAIQ